MATEPPFPLVQLTVGMRINVTLKRIVGYICTVQGRREEGKAVGGRGYEGLCILRLGTLLTGLF